MFRNYAIRPQLVNMNNPRNHTCPTRPLVQSEDVAEIATTAAYWAKRAAIGAVVVYGVVKLIDTGGEIALIAARNHI